MQLGGEIKRQEGKGSEFVCRSVCEWSYVAGWRGLLGSPPPQPAPLTPSPTPGPSQGQGIRQVERQAKPLGLFKSPKASNKSNILCNQVQPFLSTSQTFAYNPL